MKRLALALTLSLLACSKEKGEDCKKLVQAVGPRHAALTEAFGRSDQQPSELETQATTFEAAAKELQALDVKDEGVKALASEYAGVLTSAAKVRRDQATAGSALDPTAAAKAQAASVTLVTDEMRVKAKIDTACR